MELHVEPSPLGTRGRSRSPLEEEESETERKEERKKVRQREKGRDRQRRKRERDKRAKEVSATLASLGSRLKEAGSSDWRNPRPEQFPYHGYASSHPLA